MNESPFKKLRIVNIFLVVCILIALLLLGKNVMTAAYSKKSFKSVETPDKAEPHLTAIKGIMSYSPILENNPFGSSQKLIPIASDRAVTRDASVSELILFGTVVGPKKMSYAILEDTSHPDSPGQEIFIHGDTVYDFGQLTDIGKEWIELTAGTETSRIYLLDPQAEERYETNSNSSSTSFAQKVNEKQYILDQQKVQQSLDNPEQILTDARLLPNIRNGSQEGFKIFEIKPGGLYESLGLRNGDILLRVNNLEISRPEVAIQAMSALRGMNSVNLDIIRSNSKMTLTYQIR
jgi:general secretion pathway protein C